MNVFSTFIRDYGRSNIVIELLERIKGPCILTFMVLQISIQCLLWDRSLVQLIIVAKNYFLQNIGLRK